MPTSEGVVIVDDKFAADAPDIVAKVKTLTDKPIKYVLNTHQHGDHTGGNQAMLASGAEIIIHKQARANMVKAEQPGIPRLSFSDEQDLMLGGKEVIAKYVGRGHTNGDAVILFPGERVLHTGDLFVTTGAPFCDTANGGSIKDWDSTIQKALRRLHQRLGLHHSEGPPTGFRHRHSRPRQHYEEGRSAEVGHYTGDAAHPSQVRVYRRRGGCGIPHGLERPEYVRRRHVRSRPARNV
jgi:glyoxylase-like metal-dependent hydrolase (beta-lactamase superfamily II)